MHIRTPAHVHSAHAALCRWSTACSPHPNPLCELAWWPLLGVKSKSQKSRFTPQYIEQVAKHGPSSQTSERAGSGLQAVLQQQSSPWAECMCTGAHVSIPPSFPVARVSHSVRCAKYFHVMGLGALLSSPHVAVEPSRARIGYGIVLLAKPRGALGTCLSLVYDTPLARVQIAPTSTLPALWFVPGELWGSERTES